MQAVQHRKQKREEAMSKKRSIGTSGSPPHCVVCGPDISVIGCSSDKFTFYYNTPKTKLRTINDFILNMSHLITHYIPTVVTSSFVQ